MKHVLGVWAALITGCGAATSGPATSPSSSSIAPQLERIERIGRGLLPPVQWKGEDVRYSIEQRMREPKVPAVSIAVFDNYKLQWAKAYGIADVESGQQATEATIFLASSISESVHALAILFGAADGTLALVRPINELLDSWKLPDSLMTRVSPVSLRKLLSHTAGTTVHDFPGYPAGAPLPTIQQISTASRPRTPGRSASNTRPGRC